MSDTMRKISVVVLFTVLFLPAVQQVFRVFPEVELGLFEQPVKTPELRADLWFDGSFASQAEFYTSRNLGFRNHLVVALSRLEYKIFGQGSGDPKSTLMLGKESWIFSTAHVQTYRSPREVSDENKALLVKQLIEIQTRLDERGIAFFFSISPNKAEIMFDHLPEEAIRQRAKYPEKTMYEQLLPELESAGVRVLDGRASLLAMRERGVQNVFPREGAHWSYYGNYLFCLEMLEAIQPHIEQPLRLPAQPEFKLCDSKGTDNDERNKLEVMIGSDIKPLEKLPYPMPSPAPLPIDQRPNVLIVGSSHAKTTIDSLNIIRATGKLDLLYYFRVHYDVPAEDRAATSVVDGIPTYTLGEDVNWQEFLNNKQILILDSNEVVLHDVGWGFQESLLEYLREDDH